MTSDINQHKKYFLQICRPSGVFTGNRHSPLARSLPLPVGCRQRRRIALCDWDQLRHLLPPWLAFRTCFMGGAHRSWANLFLKKTGELKNFVHTFATLTNTLTKLISKKMQHSQNNFWYCYRQKLRMTIPFSSPFGTSFLPDKLLFQRRRRRRDCPPFGKSFK